MLKDFTIKEMKNLKCYDGENNEVKHFVNVGNVTINDIEGVVTKLEFSDNRSRSTYDGRELEMDGTIYKIIGDVLLEDVNTNKQYKGKFKALNAILEREIGMMVTLSLLKTKDNPPYTIEIIERLIDKYIEEYEVKLNMPCYKESYLLEFNQIVEKILDKSTYTYSVEEAELIKDLMKLSKKYKENRMPKFV